MKPISFDIEFKYKCPKCGSIFWITTKEAKTPGFKIVCCEVLEIDTIKKIQTKIEYAKTESFDSIVNEAYNTLRSMGYKLDQIIRFHRVINAKSKDELIKKFLQVQ